MDYIGGIIILIIIFGIGMLFKKGKRGNVERDDYYDPQFDDNDGIEGVENEPDDDYDDYDGGDID